MDFQNTRDFMIIILQVVSILYFIFAVRMKMWQTSLNSFSVFTTVFFIAMMSQVIPLQYWVEFHTTLLILLLSGMFIRIVYQRHRYSCGKYDRRKICSNTTCTNTFCNMRSYK